MVDGRLSGPSEGSPEAPGACLTVRLGPRGPGVITVGARGHSYELVTRTPVLERLVVGLLSRHAALTSTG